VGATTILQSVEQLGPQSPYASRVAFGNFPCERDARLVTRPGELGAFLRAGNSPYGIYVADTRTNLAGQRLNACDLNVDYTVPLAAGLGRLRLGTTGTFFLDDQFQALPSQPFFEYAGHATNGGTGAQGTIPCYRFHSRAAWQTERWDVTVTKTYLPSVTDLGPGGIAFATSPTLRRLPVANYLAWDLSAGYTFEAGRGTRGLWRYFRGLKVSAGINNLTNRLPPLASQAFNESNADIATYPVVGRLVFVNATVRF